MNEKSIQEVSSIKLEALATQGFRGATLSVSDIKRERGSTQEHRILLKIQPEVSLLLGGGIN